MERAIGLDQVTVEFEPGAGESRDTDCKQGEQHEAFRINQANPLAFLVDGALERDCMSPERMKLGRPQLLWLLGSDGVFDELHE